MNNWKDKDFPREKWVWQAVEDVGKGLVVPCEMCKQESVRILHTVHHDKHGKLKVSRNCAEQLCQDLVNIPARDLKMRNQSARREQFKRASWYINKDGVYCATNNKHLVQVFITPAGRWIIEYKGQQSPDSYPTARAAKEAAFDYMERQTFQILFT